LKWDAKMDGGGLVVGEMVEIEVRLEVAAPKS
jgi:hypothetical protein